jgi:ABC-2 type transport system permease protein
MKSFFALLRAGFFEFVRDRMAMFWTLAFPIMFIVIFGVIFSEQDATAYPVGVVLEDPSDLAALQFFCTFEMVDHDPDGQPELSAEDVTLCQAWLQQGGAPVAAAPDGGQSGQIPLQLQRGPLDAEMQALKNGDRAAVLVFPDGFDTQVAQARQGAGPGADVEVHYDASQTNRAQIVTSIVASMIDVYNRRLSGAVPAVNAELMSTTADQFNYLDFFVPGVVAVSLMQLGIFGAMTIVSLRERKILKRLGATPLPRSTLVLSQVVLRLLIAVVQAGIVLAVGRLLYGVQVGDRIGLMVGFILLGGLTFVSIGYLVAAFARTEAAGNALVQVIQFPMMFLSGVYFPIDFAPDWLRPIVNLLPLTYLGDALRQVMVEGSSRLFSLQLDAVVLTGWLVVSLAVSFRFFRWE